MGTMEVTGATWETIARWAAEGEGFVDVTMHTQPMRYTAGWEDGDVVATQGDAPIHVDRHASVKDAVPDDLMAARDANA